MQFKQKKESKVARLFWKVIKLIALPTASDCNDYEVSRARFTGGIKTMIYRCKKADNCSQHCDAK